MKNIASLFFFHICLFLVLLSELTCEGAELHKRVYVSSSSGNDFNNGFSENTPKRTIKEALRVGDTLLLKCGDVFYENIEINGGKLSSYGTGSRPIISGYRRLSSVRWELVGESLWRIKLSDNGFVGYDTSESPKLNNIGCFHEYDSDLIHGRRVQYRNELLEDWDFWQTDHYGSRQIKDGDYDCLYLFLEQDPNQLNLEYSVGTYAARIRDGIIDGIRFEGFGFGISASTKSIIRNCEVDAIGGMQFNSNEVFCSYGNGIEFWVGNDIEDCLVENNIVSRCYDSGITIQGSNSKKATPRNIIIRNNTIYDCCQAWEDFLRNDDDVVYVNCVFERNTILNSGKTAGFGYPKSRKKYCHVLGNNDKGNKGMIIRKNTFVGGNFYCSGAFAGEYKSNIWQNNICIIKRGDYLLSNYQGTKDVIRIPVDKGGFKTLKAATNDAIIRYRKLTGDSTTTFKIKQDSVINRKIKKLKKQI